MAQRFFPSFPSSPPAAFYPASPSTIPGPIGVQAGGLDGGLHGLHPRSHEYDHSGSVRADAQRWVPAARPDLVLLLLALLGLGGAGGCAPKPRGPYSGAVPGSTLDGGYPGHGSGRSLAILPIDPAQIHLVGDPLSESLMQAFPAFSASRPGDQRTPDPAALLARALAAQLRKALDATPGGPNTVAVPDSLPAAPDSPSIPDSTWLTDHGVEAELALALWGIEARDVRRTMTSFSVGGTIVLAHLAVKGRYLVWDYAAGLPVSSGSFESRVDYRPPLEARDWVKAFDAALRDIPGVAPVY